MEEWLTLSEYINKLQEFESEYKWLWDIKVCYEYEDCWTFFWEVTLSPYPRIIALEKTKSKTRWILLWEIESKNVTHIVIN